MVNSTNGVLPTSAATDLIFAKTTAAASSDSFAQQLISALQGYMNQAGSSSRLEIDIQAEPGQNSGSSQFLVTVKNLGNVAPAPTAAPAAALVAAKAIAAPVTTGIDKSRMTPTDAYWATQPPEVQALRRTSDEERGSMAADLAAKGFAIDVPIMLWGWDPLVVMTARQTAGYTWVPSALQPPVAVGPGLNFPGLASYDPKTPPPGSIKVSTDFAIGTNNQDPWIKI